MADWQNLLAPAAVPAFNCPPGTKVHFLNLGILRGDEGWSVSPSHPANHTARSWY